MNVPVSIYRATSLKTVGVHRPDNRCSYNGALIVNRHPHTEKRKIRSATGRGATTHGDRTRDLALEESCREAVLCKEPNYRVFLIPDRKALPGILLEPFHSCLEVRSALLAGGTLMAIEQRQENDQRRRGKQ